MQKYNNGVPKHDTPLYYLELVLHARIPPPQTIATYCCTPCLLDRSAYVY